ncbi:uncharacterized protein LOC131648550 [Vicia villosa]|uniref:uncharacterized protein LOC131648550 n=1 Tax=Vicia villosa TaxID=3911 RepID=UPI00273C5684|nr:uncharacterized protein LOC131648550 [Vicia villosa]
MFVAVKEAPKGVMSWKVLSSSIVAPSFDGMTPTVKSYFDSYVDRIVADAQERGEHHIAREDKLATKAIEMEIFSSSSDGQNQSTKNGKAAPIGQSKPNDGKPPPRDRQTATPSTQSSKQVEDLEADAESLQVEIPIPENIDPVTAALLSAVNRTNTLLFEQNKRIIAALGKKRRSRTPPKRRYHHRSSSSSRSPPRRKYRNRSYSPSPRRGSMSPGYKRDRSDSESPRGRKRNRGAASKKTSVSKHKDLSPRKKPASLIKDAGKPSRKLESPPSRDIPRNVLVATLLHLLRVTRRDKTFSPRKLSKPESPGEWKNLQ